MWKVIGQERAVSLLSHGLANNSLAHAYLFVGPEHVGKMTLALDLAKALNCEAGERPCQVCASCKKIRDDSGYWQQLEVYLGSHSELRFSHGLCPECRKKLYPDLS